MYFSTFSALHAVFFAPTLAAAVPESPDGNGQHGLSFVQTAAVATPATGGSNGYTQLANVAKPSSGRDSVGAAAAGSSGGHRRYDSVRFDQQTRVAAELLQPPLAYVAVFSRRSSIQKRFHLRHMWAAIAKSSGIVHRFAICDGEDEFAEHLRNEMRIYADIELLPCSDSGQEAHLTRRLLLAMDVYRHLQPTPEVFIRIDDDTFVSHRLFEEPIRGAQDLSRVFGGVVRPDPMPCRNSSHPEYEPWSTFPRQLYPLTISSSSGVILGSALVTAIMDRNIGWSNLLWNDDRAVGVWIGKLREQGFPVELRYIEGIDFPSRWFPEKPGQRWSTWGQYPQLVHHGLHVETIDCLASADQKKDPQREIGQCFQEQRAQPRQFKCFPEVLQAVPKQLDIHNVQVAPIAFISIFTRRVAIRIRKGLRKVWKPMTANRTLVYKFTICNAKDPLTPIVAGEAERHHDLLMLDCEEGADAGKLTKKLELAMQVFLNWNPPPKLFMKIDHDTFVSRRFFPGFLYSLAKQGNVYAGMPKTNPTPCRNSSHNQYEPPSVFNRTLYPQAMAGGPGYILNRFLVLQIFETGLPKEYPLWNEDRAVGVWLGKLREKGTSIKTRYLRGIAGWRESDRPTSERWSTLKDYSSVVHHGLLPDTIECLAAAEAGQGDQRVGSCFVNEPSEHHDWNPCWTEVHGATREPERAALHLRRQLGQRALNVPADASVMDEGDPPLLLPSAVTMTTPPVLAPSRSMSGEEQAEQHQQHQQQQQQRAIIAASGAVRTRGAAASSPFDAETYLAPQRSLSPAPLRAGAPSTKDAGEVAAAWESAPSTESPEQTIPRTARPESAPAPLSGAFTPENEISAKATDDLAAPSTPARGTEAVTASSKVTDAAAPDVDDDDVARALRQKRLPSRAYTEVDRAVLLRVGSCGLDCQHEVEDVTEKVNALIAAFGLFNLTVGHSLSEVFGEPPLGDHSALRLLWGNRTLVALDPSIGGPLHAVYDISALFRLPPRVDKAIFVMRDVNSGDGGPNSSSVDVTVPVNSLIEANGVANFTAGACLSDALDAGAGQAVGQEDETRAPYLHVLREGKALDVIQKSDDSDGVSYSLRSLIPINAASKQPPVSAFVGIFSRTSSVERRGRLREAWKRMAGESHVTIRFLVCAVNDSRQALLDVEHNAHQDLHILNCTDEEAHTRELKLQRSMEYFLAQGVATNFFVKVDDDTFVAWRRLSKILATEGSNVSYLGMPVARERVCRDTASPLYESYSSYSFPTYPAGMASNGYVLGRDLVARLVEQQEKMVKLRRFTSRMDRSVGLLVNRLQKAGASVEFVNVSGIYDRSTWLWQHPAQNWATWAEYPHVIHKGLRSETIECLSFADVADADWYSLERCFSKEDQRSDGNARSVCNQPVQSVDEALYGDINSPNTMVDVTEQLNDVIATYGLGNFTGQTALSNIFDHDGTSGNVLKVSVAEHSMVFREQDNAGPTNNVFSLEPLFLHVDSSLYISGNTSRDVTEETNAFINKNGVGDFLGRRSLSSALNTSNASAGFLRITVGNRSLSVCEDGKVVGGFDETCVVSKPLRPRASNLAQLFAEDDAPSIFVVVFSDTRSSMQRKAVRAMWQAATAQYQDHVSLRFIVCKTHFDHATEKFLDTERKRHHDISTVSCSGNSTMPSTAEHLLSAMHKFQSASSQPKFFMKADDDTFVNWHKLFPTLARKGHPSVYMGVPLFDADPCRKESPAAADSYGFNESELPPAMAGGPGYVLGSELVARILEDGEGQGSMLQQEDWAVGVWMRKFQNKGMDVEFLALSGVDDWWSLGLERPGKYWSSWADYPYVLHHGLHYLTLVCLTHAGQLDAPWRDISGCFNSEAPKSGTACQAPAVLTAPEPGATGVDPQSAPVAAAIAAPAEATIVPPVAAQEATASADTAAESVTSGDIASEAGDAANSTPSEPALSGNAELNSSVDFAIAPEPAGRIASWIKRMWRSPGTRL